MLIYLEHEATLGNVGWDKDSVQPLQKALKFCTSLDFGSLRRNLGREEEQD